MPASPGSRPDQKDNQKPTCSASARSDCARAAVSLKLEIFPYLHCLFLFDHSN